MPEDIFFCWNGAYEWCALNQKASELGKYDLAILVMKTAFIFTMKVKPINIHIGQKHIREFKGIMNLEVNSDSKWKGQNFIKECY